MKAIYTHQTSSKSIRALFAFGWLSFGLMSMHEANAKDCTEAVIRDAISKRNIFDYAAEGCTNSVVSLKLGIRLHDGAVVDGDDKLKIIWSGEGKICDQAPRGKEFAAFYTEGSNNVIRNLTISQAPKGLHFTKGSNNRVENVVFDRICQNALTSEGSVVALNNQFDDSARPLVVTQNGYVYAEGNAVSGKCDQFAKTEDHGLVDLCRNDASVCVVSGLGDVANRCKVAPVTPQADPPKLPSNIKIALIGDSTVATYSNKGKQGWGSQLSQYVVKSRVKVENRAKGGTSTRTFAKLKNWTDTLNSKPRYLLIQFGHNDQGGDSETATSPSTYKNNLRKFAEQAKAKGIRPIFVTPLRRVRFSGGKSQSNLVEYSNAVRGLGKEMGLPVVDLDRLSGIQYNAWGESKTRTYFEKNDGTHTNTAGAKVIAGLVADEVQKVVPEISYYFE